MRAIAARTVIVACVLVLGCAMQRHREQVRQGFLTTGLHREAFLKEWGPPSRTSSVTDPNAYRAPFGLVVFGGTVTNASYDIWDYDSKNTRLVFDGVRLVRWGPINGPTSLPAAPQAQP